MNPSHLDRRATARSHYEELGRIGHALGSPARLRLIDLLRQGPRTVEALATQSQLSVANTSQHLQLLRSAHLVESQRQGQQVEYRLASDDVSRLFGSLRGLAEALLPAMDRIRGELDVLSDEARQELLGRIARREVTLIDVRPSEEFDAGHIDGALCVPLPALPDRLGELPRDRPVVACCRGPYCPMALEAVEQLRAAGFEATHLDLGPPDVERAPRRRRAALPRPRADATTRRSPVRNAAPRTPARPPGGPVR